MQADVIISVLSKVRDNWDRDELAYLAMTSKIEFPFRDRLAHELYKKLGSEPQVAREWRKTDIAILENGSPVTLIELKAMYSAEMTTDTGLHNYTGYIEKDFMKARSLTPTGEVFAILLATHPRTRFPKSLKGVAKYYYGVNRAFTNSNENQSAIAEKAKERLRLKIGDSRIADFGSIEGGKAFGIEVDILYWLITEASH